MIRLSKQSKLLYLQNRDILTLIFHFPQTNKKKNIVEDIMKKTFLLFILALCSIALFAQNEDWFWAKKAGGTSYDNGLSIAIDANENSYMVELTFAYYPLTYAGVSCGIEWNDNHGDRPLIERYEDDEYDPKRVIKINLTPGLAFRTPTLWLSKRRTAGLMLHCEPGLCITPFYNDRVSFTEIKDAQGVGHPASYEDELYGNATIRTVSNHGGKWLAWRIKSALTFRSGDVFLSLGWLTSDFNIENGRNNIRYTKGKRYNGIEKYKHTNTLFASITGQFCIGKVRIFYK